MCDIAIFVMNTGNWTKLYGNTIYSTVWQEPPAIRCVWITMLAIADFEGYVGASVPGLAKAANVSLEETLAALERFCGPDEYSRTRDHDGRRIEEASGGWKILNFVAHRDGNEDQREKWARQKRIQRANKKKQVGSDFPTRSKSLPGENAAVKALANGDAAGAERITEAALPESVSIPEVPTREQGQSNHGSLAQSTPDAGNSGNPPGPVGQEGAESGVWVDGVWVPD